MLKNDSFDINQSLEEVLQGVGFSQRDSGGAVVFKGKDPVIASPVRIGSAASIGLAAKSVAMAALYRERGGEGQDITIDLRTAVRRFSPFHEKKWELLNGYPPGNPADPRNPYDFYLYQCADGRWVMPLNPYPYLKDGIRNLLQCTDTIESVTEAIKKWNAPELEEAAAKVGVVMPMVRTVEEFINEPQYKFLMEHPLIEIEKISDGKPEPLPKFSPNCSMPLEGLKALGMAHVIAGSGVGRALALHGADVLNIWRPVDWEIDKIYCSSNVGMRSSTVDYKTPAGREIICNLLKSADIFFANHRTDFLEKEGFAAEDCAQLRPGIIYASLSLYGRTGPWKDRPGFDQTAGCVTGMFSLQGTEQKPELFPILLVNDYISGWLTTTGIIQALIRRATEGGSYRVHVSLARVALWMLQLGVFDKDYVTKTVGSSEEHRLIDPELFTAETPCGFYQGVAEQVLMSKTPGKYKTVLVPRGSCPPCWLDGIKKN